MNVILEETIEGKNASAWRGCDIQEKIPEERFIEIISGNRIECEGGQGNLHLEHATGWHAAFIHAADGVQLCALSLSARVRRNKCRLFFNKWVGKKKKKTSFVCRLTSMSLVLNWANKQSFFLCTV